MGVRNDSAAENATKLRLNITELLKCLYLDARDTLFLEVFSETGTWVSTALPSGRLGVIYHVSTNCCSHQNPVTKLSPEQHVQDCRQRPDRDLLYFHAAYRNVPTSHFPTCTFTFPAYGTGRRRSAWLAFPPCPSHRKIQIRSDQIQPELWFAFSCEG